MKFFRRLINHIFKLDIIDISKWSGAINFNLCIFSYSCLLAKLTLTNNCINHFICINILKVYNGNVNVDFCIL